MNADGRRLPVDEITGRVIASAFEVSNALGSGFLEKVYENALFHEIRKNGLQVEQQKSIKIRYDGVVVGDYFADLLVEDVVLVELKVVKEFDDIHLAQCLNYLKATNREVCLLLNFAKPRVEIKRIVHNPT